jgi:GNAT superfamily N-acetyltransferase
VDPSIVRKAKSSDVPQLAGLSTQLGYPVSEGDLAAYLSALGGDRDHAVFVCEIESGRICGFIHVLISKRMFLADFAELGGLVVDRDCQGSGHGKKLLEAAEGWAAARGIKEIKVRSNVIRAKARDFYLGRGYQEYKKQNVFQKKLK